MNRSPDRRRGIRATPGHWGWRDEAILRPGVAVRVVDLSEHGVRIDAPARLRPGRPAELQLAHDTTDERRLLRGRVGRCQVTALHPLRYEGTIEFDAPTAVRAEPADDGTTGAWADSRNHGVSSNYPSNGSVSGVGK